jgi:hypothetical protein
MPRFRLPPAAIVISAALIAAALTGAPALSDPTGAPLPAGLSLHAPPLYLVFAPLFTTWDGISLLGMTRLKGFLWGIALGYVLWRAWQWRRRQGTIVQGLRHELSVVSVFSALFVLYVLAGLTWHRPMLALQGAGPDAIVVDPHSHTNVSHDVQGTLMRGYDAAANRRWHANAGFDAVFITDHNTTAGWRADPTPGASPRLCRGIEVSAWKAHIVLLGDTADVDRTLYASGRDGVLALLRDSGPRYHSLAVASLPEYDRALWNDRDSLVAAGVAGFEIVNASPKAADFAPAHRDSIIALARAHGLFVAGVNDSHGWGATSMTWTLVRLPGWRQLSDPCPALLSVLATPGDAVQIVERTHLTRESRWPMVLTPLGMLWVTWRTQGWDLTLSWLAWTWLIALLSLRLSRKRADR